MFKNDKKIERKNYIQVAILIIITIVVVAYLSSWYANYKKDKLSVPVIDGVLSEINYEELDPYLKENNGDMYLYICTSDEEICRNFEKEFIKIIEKKDLYDDIIYLNITKEENKTDFIKRFNKKYAKEKKVSSYPSLIKFENSKIKESIGNTIPEIKKYLDDNEIN